MSNSPLYGQNYRVAFTLYDKECNRAVDVLEFENGEIYLDEKERVGETAFENRHSGRLVGPLASLEEAESFAVATAWFRGDK